jgi:hypothetical protein
MRRITEGEAAAALTRSLKIPNTMASGKFDGSGEKAKSVCLA